MENRKFFQCTEFIATIGWLIAFQVVFFKEIGPVAWANAVTIMVAGYIISRSLFKKGRPGRQYTGLKTTELWLCILAEAAIVWAWLHAGLPGGHACLCIAILQAAFNVGRGIAKLIGSQVQVIPI